MSLDLPRAPPPSRSRLADLPTRDLNARRNVKVRLPSRLLVQLHAAKVLRDHNISDTVEEALRLYFASLPGEGAPARAGAEARAPDAPAPAADAADAPRVG